MAYKTVLQLSHGEQRPLRRVQAELDSYLEAKEMREELTPWFLMWKKWFLDKIRFQDHELVEQPVGFIYFIMVDEADPNRAIDNMRREMPSQYKQGLYMDGSPQTGQEFLFILNTNPGSAQYQNTVSTVSNRFP